MGEKQFDLAQQIAWLKDYIILDRRDYEKLVKNSKPVEGTLEAANTQIALLKKQLQDQENWAKYLNDKYHACLNELKKKTNKWWKF